ncbi:MAG: hypothetical protein H7Y33_02785 [Cytophagales bacterium]|nr:hypothetical protein [Rhizobacter sp.]
MHFKAKAVMVSVMFLVPVLALGLSFYNDKAASIEFSAKERLGIEYARDLMPTLKLAVQHRTSVGTPAAAELRGKVEAQLKVLAATEARLGAGLGTAPQFASLSAAAKAVSESGEVQVDLSGLSRYQTPFGLSLSKPQRISVQALRQAQCERDRQRCRHFDGISANGIDRVSVRTLRQVLS